MKIRRIDEQFSICKVKDYSLVDLSHEFTFVSKTDEENSLVCPTKYIPLNVLELDHGWRAFRIEGILDFSLIGILSKISTILANHQIGIFAISTFNTDYIFVKEESFEKAIESLKKEGYTMI